MTILPEDFCTCLLRGEPSTCNPPTGEQQARTWCTSARENLRALLARMLATSAKPSRLWSVNTVRRPRVRACSSASCAWRAVSLLLHVR